MSEYERQYEDGTDPRVLDVIDVPLVGPRANRIQQENWLLDPDTYWARVERMPFSELDDFIDRGGDLWLNGHHTYNGRNDQIPVDQAADAESSLKLVRVDVLRVRVFAPGEAFGNSKRRVQGQFRWEGVDYWLWITDPVRERDFLARDDGEYSLGTSFLTVSLGEPYSGFCYKLIAAVIDDDGEGPR